MKCVRVAPGKSSDHSIISLELKLIESPQRGKGFWKFNNDLLNNNAYVHLIKGLIRQIKDIVNFENKNTLWDYVKREIRSQTINFASKKAKQRREHEMELFRKLNILEQNIPNENSDEYLNYVQCKQEWQTLPKKKNDAIILRTRALREHIPPPKQLSPPMLCLLHKIIPGL